MKRAFRVAALAAGVALALGGCSGVGGGGGAPGPGPEGPAVPAASPLQREMNPSVPPGDLETAVAGVNGLGFELLRASEGNAVVGPTALSSGLAKLYAGAGGDTTGELAESAALSLPRDRLLPALNALDLELSNRLGTQSFRSSASAAAQSGYGYRLSYLDALARNSGVKPEFVDFAGAGSETRLTLSDRLSWGAAWVHPTDPADPRMETFTPAEGGTVSVPMLHFLGEFRTAQAEDYFAVEVPLATGELAILFVAPTGGTLASFEASWDAVRLDEIVRTLAPAELALAVPTFAVSRSLPARDALQRRGLSRALTADAADFSGVDGTRDLYISSLTASSCFELWGGGAVGSTSFSSALDDAHPQTWTSPAAPGYGLIAAIDRVGQVLVIDTPPNPAAPVVALARPFLFAVRDTRSGALLFLGRVVDPSEVRAALQTEIGGFLRPKTCSVPP